MCGGGGGGFEHACGRTQVRRGGGENFSHPVGAAALLPAERSQAAAVAMPPLALPRRLPGELPASGGLPPCTPAPFELELKFIACEHELQLINRNEPVELGSIFMHLALVSLGCYR